MNWDTTLATSRKTYADWNRDLMLDPRTQQYTQDDHVLFLL